MSRCLKVTGFLACCVAVLVMTGGHWVALQSVAWGRMIVDFSRKESLTTALSKTFDGKHPCALCLEVRKGWQQDSTRQKTQPWLNLERMPEPFWESRPVTAPPAPTLAGIERPFVPVLRAEFIDSPPTPPPRISTLS